MFLHLRGVALVEDEDVLVYLDDLAVLHVLERPHRAAADGVEQLVRRIDAENLRLGSREKGLSHLALGLGFQCYGVRFDAAYLTANDAIGGAMTFGLGYSF